MIRFRLIFKINGLLMLFIAAAMLLPLLVSIIYNEKDVFAFIVSILTCLVAAGIMYLPNRLETREINHRDGFIIVSLGWFSSCLIGALPFLFAGTFNDFTSCFFESSSGFTTTGASVLQDIECLPHGILLWRSLTHWLGGMGIILLSLAILPLLGVGGMELFRAEVPGTVLPDRLSPRISETARILWWVYLLFSFAEFMLLWTGGMSMFDSICHTFGTMGTGGYSTKNASIAYYDSAYFHVVITFFMFIAGSNYFLHYQMLKGDIGGYFKDVEFRTYAGLFLGTTLIFTFILYNQGFYQSIWRSLQFASFQVISILTTTGYATADFEQWPGALQYILVLFMFVGGMSGSTSGGMKLLRMIIIVKAAYRELFRLVHPHAVVPLRLGRRVVSDHVVNGVLSYSSLFISLFVLAAIMMNFLGLDLTTAVTSVIACIGNIGPALGGVGPTDNYSAIPFAGKWILILCMLLGRLEIYTVFILLVPEFWRK